MSARDEIAMFCATAWVSVLVCICVVAEPGQQPSQGDDAGEAGLAAGHGKPSPQPKLEQPKQPQPGGGGRVVELPSDRLPRFKTPVPQPPKHHHPPQKPGGHWHWHTQRGHIWLPGPVVSPTFVLPPTYTLPPRVHYYEQPAASYVICPHCGNRIVLE